MGRPFVRLTTGVRPATVGRALCMTAAGTPYQLPRSLPMSELRSIRPVLNPALRRVWRDSSTLQFGLDPRHALMITDLDPQLARILAELDGRRTEAQVLADAGTTGTDVIELADILRTLRTSHAVLDAAADPSLVTAFDPGDPLWTPAQVDRAVGTLIPDRAALSLLVGAEESVRTLAGRQAASIVVHGGGRVGVPVATLLAAAGVAQVSVGGDGVVAPVDCAPGGVTLADLHRSVRSAAAEAIRRAAPDADPTPPAPGQSPDLVVIAGAAPYDADLRTSLHASGLPHLVAGIRETTGVVGPLVIPGVTSCLRCADLHRTDRDHTWPLVAAQLAARRSRHAAACDVVLALRTASLAAMQALQFLDGSEPAALNGTLELISTEWQVRRRSWAAHDDCECGALERAG